MSVNRCSAWGGEVQKWEKREIGEKKRDKKKKCSLVDENRLVKRERENIRGSKQMIVFNFPNRKQWRRPETTPQTRANRALS